MLARPSFRANPRWESPPWRNHRARRGRPRPCAFLRASCSGARGRSRRCERFGRLRVGGTATTERTEVAEVPTLRRTPSLSATTSTRNRSWRTDENRTRASLLRVPRANGRPRARGPSPSPCVEWPIADKNSRLTILQRSSRSIAANGQRRTNGFFTNLAILPASPLFVSRHPREPRAAFPEF